MTNVGLCVTRTVAQLGRPKLREVADVKGLNLII